MAAGRRGAAVVYDMQRLANVLRLTDLPPMARPAFAIELRHMFLWGLFANLIDGSFSSIVVAKTFDSPLLVPVVWATPMLAHLLTFLWGVVIRGRPKVRTFVVLAIGALVSAGSIAFTPSDWHPWGGWVFAGQIAVARIFLSGLVTVRTSIWQANYPQAQRARIAGRIQTLSALLMVGMGATVSLLFDQHAEYYRIVYPVIAVFGALSLLPLRRLRIRGERRDLRRLNRLDAANGEGGGTWSRLRRGISEAISILRRDRDFARYCTAQYWLGSANFMTDPVLTVFLTQGVGLGYFGTYLLMEQIPTLVSLFTIRLWAPLFDRVGVLRFRVVNSAFWLASIALAAVALILFVLPPTSWASLPILVVGRLLNGVGRGGGAIAWNLGHLHFAGPDDAELYMGIHVALTGLRGMIMPFVGAKLYQIAGPGALTLGIVLASISLHSFHRMSRAGPAKPRAPST